MHNFDSNNDTVTREEFLQAMKTINAKLDEIRKVPKFITRPEIIDERGRKFYEDMKRAVPYEKGPGKKSRVRFSRKDYEMYIESLFK